MIHSIVENMRFQITYFASYVPAMKVLKKDSTILCTDIQDDTFNIVIDAHFTPENANQKIDETIETFQKKGLPFSWWTGPNDSPANLKELLMAKGFSPKENDYSMYLDLGTYTSKPTQKLKLKQVSNPHELKGFDQVHVQSFGPSKTFEAIFSKIPNSAYQAKAPYRFYTGYSNGKAVTTGVLVFHAEVAGIYFIVTLPEERRKGYATEMMHYLLAEAKKENQKTAVLLASEDGKKVYQKMGFTECCIFQELVLKKQS